MTGKHRKAVYLSRIPAILIEEGMLLIVDIVMFDAPIPKQKSFLNLS